MFTPFLKPLQCLLCLLLLTIGATAQEVTTLRNAAWGITMNVPKDWHNMSRDKENENLSQTELDEEQKARLLAARKRALLLQALAKYRVEDHEGIIPTIRISVRPVKEPGFAAFMPFIKESAQASLELIGNGTLSPAPQKVMIDSVPAVYYAALFNLPVADGKVLPVRSRVYSIPRGKYYLEIIFMDSKEAEDLSVFYDALLQSVRIDKH